MSFDYSEFEGREFRFDDQNCYTLLRDVYKARFGIELTDYACPSNWWANGFDLYRALADQEGFEVLNVNPREWQEGDVLVIAVQSSVGNHCAIWLDSNLILHHLVGNLSSVTQFGGMFRNGLLGVYRHKDVKIERANRQLDLTELLPPHVRRRMEQRRAAREAEGAPSAGA